MVESSHIWLVEQKFLLVDFADMLSTKNPLFWIGVKHNPNAYLYEPSSLKSQEFDVLLVDK